MNKTYRAVLLAFNRELFPKFRNTYFISEPEACALYTVTDLLKKGLINNLLKVRACHGQEIAHADTNRPMDLSSVTLEVEQLFVPSKANYMSAY